MVKYLADKFNSLPERKGKENVLSNIKAVKRLEKEVVKIKEILSSNKQSSVKIPELLDYVTLQLLVDRTDIEAVASSYF